MLIITSLNSLNLSTKPKTPVFVRVNIMLTGITRDLVPAASALTLLRGDTTNDLLWRDHALHVGHKCVKYHADLWVP